MAIIIEHDKRKHEILENAFDVFIEEGYANATFQKIADRCGITRTTLYVYFKNKRDIFSWSIKQLIAALETRIMKIINNKSYSAETCFREMLNAIVDAFEENKKIFSVLLDYLLQLKKSGGDPQERVSRRVIKLRHLMSNLLIRGMENGEFKTLAVKDVNNIFFGLIESAIFQLAVLGQENMNEVRDTLSLALDGILNN